jgi:hypothetical protein
MKLTRRVTVAGAAVAAVAGAALAFAPVADAAAPASLTARPAAATVTGVTPSVVAMPAGTVAPYNGVCGTGYGVVNSAEIGVEGTVYLTYSRATGNNCVVTIRNTAGRAVPMVAQLTVTATSETAADNGNYTSYAGPVYLHAAGKCVNWYGAINGASNGKVGTNCSALAR